MVFEGVKNDPFWTPFWPSLERGWPLLIIWQVKYVYILIFFTFCWKKLIFFGREKKFIKFCQILSNFVNFVIFWNFCELLYFYVFETPSQIGMQMSGFFSLFLAFFEFLKKVTIFPKGNDFQKFIFEKKCHFLSKKSKKLLYGLKKWNLGSSGPPRSKVGSKKGGQKRGHFWALFWAIFWPTFWPLI